MPKFSHYLCHNLIDVGSILKFTQYWPGSDLEFLKKTYLEWPRFWTKLWARFTRRNRSEHCFAHRWTLLKSYLIWLTMKWVYLWWWLLLDILSQLPSPSVATSLNFRRDCSIVMLDNMLLKDFINSLSFKISYLEFVSSTRTVFTEIALEYWETHYFN